jgi:hypothetical protein
LRDQLLKKWLPLPKHLFVKLANGQKVYASYDSKQVGEDRLSSVQYLKFNTKGAVPVAIGCDFSEMNQETVLSDIQKEALTEDLGVVYEKN